MFPVAKRNPNIQTTFGHVEGPPPKPKLPPLSNRLYEYHKMLSTHDKKMLPRRADPKYPEALRVHMRAHQREEPLGFEDHVDLFQIEEEQQAEQQQKNKPRTRFSARFKDKV